MQILSVYAHIQSVQKAIAFYNVLGLWWPAVRREHVLPQGYWSAFVPVREQRDMRIGLHSYVIYDLESFNHLMLFERRQKRGHCLSILLLLLAPGIPEEEEMSMSVLSLWYLNPQMNFKFDVGMDVLQSKWHQTILNQNVHFSLSFMQIARRLHINSPLMRHQNGLCFLLYKLL